MHPTKRSVERVEFYKSIKQDRFIEKVKVGIQLKDRLELMFIKEFINILKILS